MLNDVLATKRSASSRPHMFSANESQPNTLSYPIIKALYTYARDLDTPLIFIDQSVYCFSRSINFPRPVFLTERKPRWAKPAHPDNRDKLGSERMNWLDLCSSQLDYQPLYFCISSLICVTFISRYKILLLWARSFSTGRYFLG